MKKMNNKKPKKFPIELVAGFAAGWIICSLINPLNSGKDTVICLLAAIITALLSFVVRYLISNKKSTEKEVEKPIFEHFTGAEPADDITFIKSEGYKALSEMGRLYSSIKSYEIKQKINEIMRITDKIIQDASQDPSDIPQIKKFLNYYIPTTIKLLNAYDRMCAQEIQGENIDKSLSNIEDMLDTAIEAYKKRLDSLFENQALDIETDIDVMNTMLAREGLFENKDFSI